MTARQQLARLLPLVVLLLLAIVGLRGAVAGPRWDGPLRAYGVIIGIALEVALGALLVITYYREHAARRRREREMLASSALAGSSGWVTGAAASELARVSAMGGAGGRLGRQQERMSQGMALAGGDDGDERDVAGGLRFLLKLVIGTAMAVIAVLLVMNLHLHWFARKPPGRKLPTIRIPTPSGTPRPAGAGNGPHVSIPLGPILYSLLVVALLAALALSIWWGRRLTQAAALPGPLDDARQDEEELREAVASGRAAMADLDDARAAIIACYAAMEASLAERGAARRAADTPGELLSRAQDRGIITGGAAGELTALFYEARFSSHPLGPPQRAAAVAALDQLSGELGDVRADSGTGP